MPLRDHAPLLGDFALEPMGLRAVGRQRRIAVADVGREPIEIVLVAACANTA